MYFLIPAGFITGSALCIFSSLRGLDEEPDWIYDKFVLSTAFIASLVSFLIKEIQTSLCDYIDGHNTY